MGGGKNPVTTDHQESWRLKRVKKKMVNRQTAQKIYTHDNEMIAAISIEFHSRKVIVHDDIALD